MRRWYEPRRDRPDLERSAIRKRGFVGYMDMLWREFFELLKLNLLFVLSCVPIITIPAALTAMHRITSVMVRDENHFLWPDYWKAFRRDFWKSLGGGAAIAAVMALFVLSTVFYYNLMQVNKVFVLLAGFAACVVLLTLCVSFYFFPMLAMVDLPLGALLKNSMALVFGNIGKTLLALLLFALLVGRFLTAQHLTAWGCMALAAAAKGLALYLVLVKLVAPTVVPAAKLAAVTAAFPWPQLVTALIGGALACLLAPVVKKALEKRN